MSLNKWYNKAKLNDDPIAQTFRILPEHAPDADGLYLTSVDLFFQAKDDKYGINVDIREVQNGMPTRRVLEFSKAHLLAKHVKTHASGETPTRVIFPGPVFLKTGSQYALTVRPDGGSPNVRIWYAKQGEDEISSGAPIGTNWGDGVFFVSASDTWEPILDADLKFRMYKAVYNPQKTGEVNMVNADNEYFTISSVSGTYAIGEEVYKVPAANVSGNLAIVKGNTTVTGSGTNFTSSFAAGDSIVVVSNSDANVADVMTVKSIESATSMTVLGGARLGIAAGKAAVTPSGVVSKYNASSGELTLRHSTAVSGKVFAASDVLKGTESAANSTVTSVDNKTVSYFQPQIYRTETSGTTITSTVKVTDKSTPGTTETKQIIFGMNNKNVKFDAAVYSKSNEITNNSGAKSLVISTKLNTNNPVVSPTLDTDISILQSYENNINNLNTNERKFGDGSASSKYVSKTVTLASGMEAEDLNVYLSGYRPANTDLEVYGMFTAPDDDDKLINKQWTKMSISPEQAELFSTDNNANDIKEFKYTVPSIPTIESSNRQPGTANTNTGNTSIFIPSAASYYSAGDLIIVTDGIEDNYVLGRVASANTTAVDVDDIPDKAFPSGSLHYKVNTDEKQAAFKYPLADGSFKLRYFDASGREHENFKYFQIKVVFLAEQTNKVPRVSDVRAIALSA